MNTNQPEPAALFHSNIDGSKRTREELDKQLAATQAALGSLAERAAAPKQNKASRGPRNLPKPDARKAQRQRVRAARRATR